MADISASNWDSTDASNNTASPDGAPEGMAPSGVNDTIRAIMGALKRHYQCTMPIVVSTSATTNTYSVSYSVAPASYSNGKPFAFIPHQDNIAGAASIYVNSLGAKSLKIAGSSGLANPAAGQIQDGCPLVCHYNTSADAVVIVGGFAPSFSDPLTTSGDLMYYSSAGSTTRLPIGTTGLPLVVNAGATEPEWAKVGITGIANAALVYDIGFVAGFTNTYAASDIAAQTYGTIIAGRNLTIEGEQASIGTAPGGKALIMDIEKDGSTIYSSKPEFADGSTTLTAGTLSTTTVTAGATLTFKVTQAGSSTAGASLRFTVKARLR